MGAPFLDPKIGEDQKKKKIFAANSGVFGPNEDRPNSVKKENYSPQIGDVMVSHHNMVSPQNGDTHQGDPHPSNATENN